jgi:hypothetical protein
MIGQLNGLFRVCIQLKIVQIDIFSFPVFHAVVLVIENPGQFLNMD